jgi:uncharacterized FAD-dependent dehydrogenase
MQKQIKTTVYPEVAFQEEAFRQHIAHTLRVPEDEEIFVRQEHRSIDARGKQVKVHVEARVFIAEAPGSPVSYRTDYPNVTHRPPVVVVGSGPGGMFAALRLVELGYKPIVLERGKDVQARRRDLAAINKSHVVNPESNYCYGEGGAGTYSDGKLYTRSKKRGDFRRILEIFVAHGANPDILVDAHPHIGTNKLPKIVSAIRESIIGAGGEFHFDAKVTGFIIRNGAFAGVRLANGQPVEGIATILATGHSARDIFELLHQQEIYIEAKPFALGVRVEHPQALIDRLQYHCEDRGPYLPAAAYSLVTQTQVKGVQKGVFSFCMCPGGFIVPAATSPGELVVNGMSPSRRNSKFANSGIVVPVEAEDLRPFKQAGPLAGVAFQKAVEQKAGAVSGYRQEAPAQLLADFVNGKYSASLLESSYQPGLISTRLDEVLPPDIARRLRMGFVDFGKKMRGYLSNEAQLVAIESRTSSPVRIPRHKDTYEHITMPGLFPCGEGAGYAGGIASAAMDGERCAEKVIEKYGQRLLSR